METKTTFLKASLVALFLLISGTAFSATYYVCSGATLSLTPAAPATSITYSWDVKQGGTSISGYPRAGVPTSLPTTAGTYQVILISTSSDPNVCAPDAVTNDFIVLPGLGLTIAAPSRSSYCGSATNNSSDITPTPTGFPSGTPYSTDLELEYSYSVVKDGGSAVNGTTVGTIDANGKFTLTTTVAGTYVITGTIKYKQKTGFTGTLLGTTGCPASSSTQTITVTASPSQPTITISAS